MTPLQFRNWLTSCAGKRISVRPGAQNTQRTGPTAANTSNEHFVPITVDRVQLPEPAQGFELQIANSTMAARDGVFVPYEERQCTRVNATLHSNGIAISGPFSGCRFVKCVDAAGNQHIGHVYYSTALPDNLPVAQAASFKAAAGAVGSVADGFFTQDRVQPPAQNGYVIGTLVAGTWSWHWLTCTPPNGAFVIECVDITTQGPWVSV